jgi:phosphotransferase system IIB component
VINSGENPMIGGTVNAQTREACATRPSTTCKTTRKADRATIKGIRVEIRAAATTYRTSNETARQTFWNAIHALKGGAGITPDVGSIVAPVTSLPAAL